MFNYKEFESHQSVIREISLDVLLDNIYHCIYCFIYIVVSSAKIVKCPINEQHRTKDRTMLYNTIWNVETRRYFTVE